MPAPPDYRGGSIVNLMATLGQGLGAGLQAYRPLQLTLPEIGRHKHLVLMVVDGLGWQMLDSLMQGSTLHDHCMGAIDSVFPSTTASAITTFLTGTAPQQHALTGWHVYTPEVDSITAVLPFRPRAGGQKLQRRAAQLLYDQQPFTARLPGRSYHIAPSWIIESRYNTAYMGKAERWTYQSMREFMPLIAVAIKQASQRSSATPHYYYAYYPEIDRLAHQYGSASAEVRAHLTLLDRRFADLLERLRGTDTLLILTADHGFIDTDLNHRIELENHPHLAHTLARPLCGESRVAYCYVRHGQHSTFVDYVQNELARQVTLVTSQELITAGYFGLHNTHPQLSARIGDYTMLLTEDFTIKDWLPGEERYQHIGVHGGSTEAERKVPVIAVSL